MVRRTKAEAEQTRHKLLDAAEQLFLQRGVSRTSLNDIAQAAGTTRGAIYWHFKDKADLFNAMMQRVTLPMEEALQHLLRRINSEDLDLVVTAISVPSWSASHSASLSRRSIRAPMGLLVHSNGAGSAGAARRAASD